MAAFRKYKRLWLNNWRATGHYSDGNFVKPVNYLEALEMVPEQLRLFLDLDTYFAILHQNYLKKKGDNNGRTK